MHRNYYSIVGKQEPLLLNGSFGCRVKRWEVRKWGNDRKVGEYKRF